MRLYSQHDYNRDISSFHAYDVITAMTSKYFHMVDIPELFCIKHVMYNGRWIAGYLIRTEVFNSYCYIRYIDDLLEYS